MRMLVLFKKGEEARYLAQLDVLRAMQRAIRRAGLPVKYSEGFNPHMLISFATGSGVGMTCEEEIMDARLSEDMAASDFVSKLDAALPPGFSAVKARRVEDWFPSLMSKVKRADYVARFSEPIEAGTSVQALLDSAELNVEVQGKRGTKLTDIRPLIYDIKLSERELFMSLACGPEGSVKPSSVLKLLPEVGESHALTRLGLYSDRDGRCPLFDFEAER